MNILFVTSEVDLDLYATKGRRWELKMITAYELEEFQKISVRDVDINTLYDVKEMEIADSLPVCERMKMMLTMYGNPYLYRDGDVKVKCSFAEDGNTLREKLETILKIK